MCLGGFFWIGAHFLYFRWIFLHGGFGSPVTHLLLLTQYFLTGNPCSLLLTILPNAAAGDNDGRVWIQKGGGRGGG